MTDAPKQTGNGADANEDVAALDAASIGGSGPLQARLAAVMFCARYHGVELDPQSVKLDATEDAPSPPVLVEWLRESGLWARGAHMNFRQVIRIDDPAPIILLLNDGGAALVVGRDRDQNTLLLRDPRGAAVDIPVAVDEVRLKQLWSGAVLLIRAARAINEEDQPFNLAMLARMVWVEKKTLRDIAISSITLTILSILPILMVMTTINTVIQYHSLNTLELVVVVLIIALGFEMLLTWGRKMMEIIMAAKLDARLNLLIFDRLMTLPIEFFERRGFGAFITEGHIVELDLADEFWPQAMGEGVFLGRAVEDAADLADRGLGALHFLHEAGQADQRAGNPAAQHHEAEQAANLDRVIGVHCHISAQSQHADLAVALQWHGQHHRPVRQFAGFDIERRGLGDAAVPVSRAQRFERQRLDRADAVDALDQHRALGRFRVDDPADHDCQRPDENTDDQRDQSRRDQDRPSESRVHVE